MKQRYWQYRNQTAFRSRLADDFSIKTLVRRLLPAPVERLFRQLWGR